MSARTGMAKAASAYSLRLRSIVHAKPWDAIDVFDLAHAAGVEVRFTNIASMEGMYLRQKYPVILVASERPPGRQRFTCAHELGHHVFGDGSRIDELFERDSPFGLRPEEEVRADMFAGLLLMPKTAVQRGFSERGLCLKTVSAPDVFRVSCWLGVGYMTLLKHLKYALHIIPEDRFAELVGHSPKSIRHAVLGRETAENLVIVDEHWDGRPVDVMAGDLVVLPTGSTVEGRVCTKEAFFTTAAARRSSSSGPGWRVCHRRRSRSAGCARD